MGINAAGEKLFKRFSLTNIFLESYRRHPAIFRKYSVSRLTRSDWVLSKTQIVRAFKMKYWKMALAEMLDEPFQSSRPIPKEDQATLPSYGNGTN